MTFQLDPALGNSYSIFSVWANNKLVDEILLRQKQERLRDIHVLKIWPTPVDFDLPEDSAEFYSAEFLFSHRGCDYIEISEDMNPACNPVIVIQLVVSDRLCNGCYQVIYNNMKYIGVPIRIWPDNFIQPSLRKFGEPLAKHAFRSLYFQQIMEDFRAAYECSFLGISSETITRKRCDTQEKRVQSSGHNSPVSNKPSA